MTRLRLTVLGSLFLALALGASAQQATLGDDGAIYTARVGSYKSLFPEGSALAPTANVLALDIEKDGELARILVPGGEKVAPDAVPFALWEGTSRRLFLAWEGLSHIHSNVRLVSFDGETWSEPLQISGNPFTTKSAPRLAVTRESYLLGDDAGSATGERTVLHIVWFEDDYGDVDILYAPVILANGVAPASPPPIFDLGRFAPPSEDTGAAPTAALLRSPRVVGGDDDTSVFVAFASEVTDQLLLLKVDVLPVELSAMADELERFLAEDGTDPCQGDVQALAERARAHLVVIGTRFSGYARAHLADALREWVLAQREGACAEGGFRALAERARAHLVVIGRRALREVIVAAKADPTFSLAFDSEGDGRINDLSLTVRSALALPSGIGPGAARIHLGGSGRHPLLSWRQNNSVLYREHDGTEWMPVRSLALSDGFDLEQAYALLDSKAR